MKFFVKLCLGLFSLIIFVLSVIVILVGLNLISLGMVTGLISEIIYTEIGLKITLICATILLLLSARFIIFKIEKKDETSTKDGIILENNNGKLIISRESLENMISSATKQIDGVGYVNSKTLLDKEHNLLVFVTITVTSGIIVKEVSKQLQVNIKETMKNTADLEVASVSINVKNIVNGKNKPEKKANKKEVVEPQIVETEIIEEKDE